MWPERAEAAGRELGGRLREFSPRAVVSPALGGVIIGHETARALGMPAMFVERKDGAFSLRRGFALEPGEPVVVVEDVFTTGKSTREAAAAVGGSGRTRRRGRLDRGSRTARRTRSRSRRARCSRSRFRPGPRRECPLCRERRAARLSGQPLRPAGRVRSAHGLEARLRLLQQQRLARTPPSTRRSAPSARARETRRRLVYGGSRRASWARSPTRCSRPAGRSRA